MPKSRKRKNASKQHVQRVEVKEVVKTPYKVAGKTVEATSLRPTGKYRIIKHNQWS